MAFIPDQQINTGQFLPTTTVFDVARLYEIEVTSPEFKELLVRLYQSVNNIALSTNIKDTGYYINEEFVTGQVYFNPTAPNPSDPSTLRSVFRKVINFGALPNTATKIVAHNIPFTSTYKITRFYGAASDTTGLNYIPIPYAALVLNENIELRADANNVYVTTGINRTNFNECYIVIEYVKQ